MTSAGLFDLLAPLLDAIDAGLAIALPAPLRIVAYALVSAVVGMLLYRQFSNQARLAEVRLAVASTQRELAGYDGDFSGLRGLVRRSMSLALRQVALTFWPALVASLPLLFVMPWLSNTFSEQVPASGDAIGICTVPAIAAESLHWQPGVATGQPRTGCWTAHWPAPEAPLELQDAQGRSWLRLPTSAPTPVLHKFGVLNFLFGNPGGYLDPAAPFDAFVFELAERDLLGMGPAWMRGWAFAFFIPLFLVSLLIKWRWRLH